MMKSDVENIDPVQKLTVTSDCSMLVHPDSYTLMEE